MEEPNYWTRWARHRLSRRRLLAGAAAVGAGAAGLAVVGCGGGGEEEVGKPKPVAPATSFPIETVKTPGGGFFRSFNFDPLPLDTRDPHETQFGPIYNMHSMVFSRVLTYLDDVNETMTNDLAASMPEIVDDLTYVFKLRPNIKFHNNPKLALNSKVGGRQLVAEDVKFSIERQLNLDSPKSGLFYRRNQWENIDKLEIVDDLTFRVTTKRPISAFVHFFADRNAWIVAREVIDENDEMNSDDAMIGTGPFIFDEMTPLVLLRVKRNPEWYAADDNPVIDGVPVGTGRPFLDGIESDGSQIVVTDDTKQELAFRGKQKDAVGFEDPSNIDRVIGEIPELRPTLLESGIGGFVNSRLLVDRPPWNDPRLRRAVHLAVDRQAIGTKLFRLFRSSSNIGWPHRRWALPQEELVKLPGYRTDQAGREEDLTEARRLWDAAGGNAAVGSIEILYASIPAYIPREALPEMERMFKEVFGASVKSDIDQTGYTQLAQRLLNNTLGKEPRLAFGWGYDNGWIHWFDWLYPFFHSTGAKNSFVLKDAELDKALDDARETFDYEESRDKVYEIQRYLLEKANDGLGVLAQIPYVNGVSRVIYWPYVKNARDFTWFGHSDWGANMWFDQSHASYAGRPS